jgi:hypothetical protein
MQALINIAPRRLPGVVSETLLTATAKADTVC